MHGDVPRSWVLELLEEGYSDRSPKAEPPPVGKISMADFQDLWITIPSKQPHFGTRRIYDQLGDLIADQMRKDANGDPIVLFMALELVLRSIMKDMGLVKVGALARFLRDYPDKFPMFSTVVRTRCLQCQISVL